MSKKLTPEELQQLKDHRSEAGRLAALLGEYTYQKTLIEFEVEVVKAGIRENAKKQQEMLKDLGSRYGDGSIDFETGEILPLPSKG